MAQTIALVDDDQNILTSVSLTLESEGFVVDCYHDGEEALVELARRPVNLGVFDIKMPRLDGIELLQKVRGQSQMPVIFLTSEDDELDAKSDEHILDERETRSEERSETKSHEHDEREAKSEESGKLRCRPANGVHGGHRAN